VGAAGGIGAALTTEMERPVFWISTVLLSLLSAGNESVARAAVRRHTYCQPGTVIRSRFPQFAGRCETLYNGFDGQTFHPPESGRYRDCAETLITVGRVSPEKGLHVLIDAFEKVLRKKRNAKLRIIGPTDWILPPEVMTDLRDSSRVYEMLKNYGQGYLEQLGHRIKGPLQTAISFVGALPPALAQRKYGRLACLFSHRYTTYARCRYLREWQAVFPSSRLGSADHRRWYQTVRQVFWWSPTILLNSPKRS
jgi:glycosyltransferase involved in cell wall biosynthesis